MAISAVPLGSAYGGGFRRGSALLKGFPTTSSIASQTIFPVADLASSIILFRIGILFWVSGHNASGFYVPPFNELLICRLVMNPSSLEDGSITFAFQV